MTFDNVLSWAIKARPGEVLIYHKGSLLTDFQNKHDHSDAVWGARYCYNAGLVDFTQKKDGSQFFYIATKRRNIEPPSPAFAKDTDKRIDRFPIPYRFYRKSEVADQLPDGRWDGRTNAKTQEAA